MKKKARVSMLSRNSQWIAPDVWYYEEPGGLDIFYGPGGMPSRRIARLSWRKLRASLRRKDRDHA